MNMSATALDKKLILADTFTKELPADPILENTRRQVHNSCFSYVTPRVPTNPELVHFSHEVLDLVGLDEKDAHSSDFLKLFSGTDTIKGSRPYAMCYGGHQFGHWAGQLGDGRAINLAQVLHNKDTWTLQLKGAGETPYSRTADGLAVLRSSIREHLCSEAMHHLGAPTTRSLSLILSGDQVLRDVMYDGNSAYEKGAIVCRVAPSFIRFGNFQIFASRGDFENLKILTDYTIRHHFSEIEVGTKEGYIQFYKKVVDLSLEMVIHWQRVGFVHGVMNTDNMSILGLTIDYGPYGWLEGYDHGWTPNTTDRTNRRYRYGYQPHIVLWNLAQLANALMPLIKDEKPLQEIIDQYKVDYYEAYMKMMKAKLGLENAVQGDGVLIKTLEDLLQEKETDMTIFFRELSNVEAGDSEKFLELLQTALYNPEILGGIFLKKWEQWFDDYSNRLDYEDLSFQERSRKMKQTNPKYVLRNYMAQMAIDKAENGDYSLVDELYSLLKNPYAEQDHNERWYAKRPDWARHKVGCSMLSCSS